MHNLYTCLVYISDSSQNTSFSIVNIHLGTHWNEIWDSQAKLELFWDLLRSPVPIETKSQIWNLVASTVLVIPRICQNWYNYLSKLLYGYVKILFLALRQTKLSCRFQSQLKPWSLELKVWNDLETLGARFYDDDYNDYCNDVDNDGGCVWYVLQVGGGRLACMQPQLSCQSTFTCLSRHHHHHHNHGNPFIHHLNH